MEGRKKVEEMEWGGGGGGERHIDEWIGEGRTILGRQQ